MEPEPSHLLKEYVEHRSEQAFTELVRRFTPVVFGVCLRVLDDRAAAEDACQSCVYPAGARGGQIAGSRPSRNLALRRGASLFQRRGTGQQKDPTGRKLSVHNEEESRRDYKRRASISIPNPGSRTECR